MKNQINSSKSKEKIIPNIFKQNNTSIFITDLKGNIIIANSSCAKLYGYSLDEIISKNISIFYQKDQNSFQNIIKNEIIETRHYYSDQVHIKKDGSFIEILMSASLIKEKNNIQDSIVFIVSKLDKNKFSIFTKENNDFKKNSYTFSRELVNNILSPILKIENTFNSIFKDKNKDSEIEETFIDIKNAMQKINRKISYLISFGGFNLEYFDNINLTSLIDEILTSYKNSYKNLMIKTKYSKDSFFIKGIKELLLTALKNIINNSVEAMKYKGILTISVFNQEDNVFVSIKDTGGGLPEKIFNNIYNGITTKEKGHGRGIIDSFEIVKLFSGSIDIKNYPGKGAVFIFNFPLNN